MLLLYAGRTMQTQTTASEKLAPSYMGCVFPNQRVPYCEHSSMQVGGTSLPNHITGTSTPSSLHNVDFAFCIHAAQMYEWSALSFSTSFLSGNDGNKDMMDLLRHRLKREQTRNELSN